MEVYTCKLMACRFRALDRMEEDRKAILLNHLGFIQRAYRECCPFHDHCVDNLLDQTLTAHSKRLTYTVCCIILKIDQNTTNEKKTLRETQTLCAKIFCPTADPIPGDAGPPKFNQLHLQTLFGEDRCTQFRVVMVTDTARPPQTLSTRCKHRPPTRHTHTDRTDYNTLHR